MNTSKYVVQERREREEESQVKDQLVGATHRHPKHGEHLEVTLSRVRHNGKRTPGQIPERPNRHQGDDADRRDRPHGHHLTLRVQRKHVPGTAPPVHAHERETHRVHPGANVEEQLPIGADVPFDRLLAEGEDQVAEDADDCRHGGTEHIVFGPREEVHQTPDATPIADDAGRHHQGGEQAVQDGEQGVPAAAPGRRPLRNAGPHRSFASSLIRCWTFFLFLAIFYQDIRDGLNRMSDGLTLGQLYFGRGHHVMCWLN